MSAYTSTARITCAPQVTPVYSAATITERGAAGQRELVDAVTAVMPKLHSLLLGPGLGRDPDVLRAAAEVVSRARLRNLPVVLDADALAMVVGNPAAVGGYVLAVLTPNANEFRLLRERMDRYTALQGFLTPASAEAPATAVAKGEEKTTGEAPPNASGGEESKAGVVERLAKDLGGVTVVSKGNVDMISNGARTISCAVPGGLKRCGGIGDVLSGAMATSLGWVALQDFGGEEVGALSIFCFRLLDSVLLATSPETSSSALRWRFFGRIATAFLML